MNIYTELKKSGAKIPKFLKRICEPEMEIPLIQIIPGAEAKLLAVDDYIQSKGICIFPVSIVDSIENLQPGIWKGNLAILSILFIDNLQNSRCIKILRYPYHVVSKLFVHSETFQPVNPDSLKVAYNRIISKKTWKVIDPINEILNS
ncbi:MAG: hypothetical protein HKN39_02505 [Flavobacteriales bacterium]|nr:hypothetical protein [Flavobacteriales bacterium]